MHVAALLANQSSQTARLWPLLGLVQTHPTTTRQLGAEGWEMPGSRLFWETFLGDKGNGVHVTEPTCIGQAPGRSTWSNGAVSMSFIAG